MRAAYGEPLAVERLGGMSVASVWRVRFAAASLIVKVSRRGAERSFYERIAPVLREAGVPIPLLEWSGSSEGNHWLVLEDLPAELDSPAGQAWTPDPRMMNVLARLHLATRDLALDLEPPGIRWTESVSEQAAECFPPQVRSPVMERFGALQDQWSSLPTGWCWISGDPSRPNWGMRNNGEAMLFDWELFRRGAPWEDLAPMVPGLPQREQFDACALAYREAIGSCGEAFPWDIDWFARAMAVAKVATVVTLLAANAGGRAHVPAEYVADLVARVPPWLESLE